MRKLEFFFDCSSPWTYLAFSRIHDLAARTGAQIGWRPILVGGVFNAVNQSVYQRRANPEPRQSTYSAKDMQDWARLSGIDIKWPPTIFPVKSVDAMRGAFVAMEHDLLVPYAWSVFRAYWGADRDISDRSVLSECATEAGLEPSAYLKRIDEPRIRGLLRETTEELIARGGFGSPTIFIGDDMYFGNDRLPLVEAALDRLPG
jgi:2-hydroxychromene-2-carboxylate isomerase